MIARRAWFALMILLASTPIAARGDDPPRAKASTLGPREWTVDGVRREALVAVPEVTEGAPLVFVWHGHGGSMGQAARSFGIHALWPEAIVVYAQGLPTPGRLTDPEGKRPGWQSNSGGEGGDRDLKFFDAMRADLLRDLKADPKKVYATGHSNGGRFTYLLWATRPDAIAAFAPTASPAARRFPRMRPKPCLHLGGESDKIVPFASQKATIDRLRALNHCDPEGKPWPPGGPTATIYPSSRKTPVITAIHPGGHQLPPASGGQIAAFFRDQAR